MSADSLLAELLGEEIPQVSLPTVNKSKHGVSLVYENVQKAIDHLGINLQVRFRWSSGTNTQGCHRVKVDKDTGEEYHSITLSHKPKISADYYSDIPDSWSREFVYVTQSRWIWHELTHCKQYETVENFGESYASYGKSGNVYKNNPYEAEARRNMFNSDWLCLTDCE